MIAPNHEDKQPDSSGDYGGGVSARRVSMTHTRMIERALREGWPIPDEHRPAIVSRQVRIALSKSSSPREATSAARCLVSMEQQNLERVFKVIDKVIPDQHEVRHTAEELREVVEATRRDETYVQLERQRTVAAGPHAGTNGHNGHAGPLANGAAPGGN